MNSIWGKNIQISVFGESHGPVIGITIHGLPAGFAIDVNAVQAELQRRAPGQNAISTSRKEADEFEIVSGFFNGFTTAAPFTAICWNLDTRSSDYHPEIPRPGHADLAAHWKYNGYNDYRGGGHFSGRLTAPLVFAGAIAKQILQHVYGTQISALHNISEQAILSAKADGDSIGGIVTCTAVRVPQGLGNPMFGSVESVLSSLLFSIPAVKGVEFGDGFGFASKRGSELNDEIAYADNGELRFLANHNGGINGGITNGEPIIVRVVFKPTPTIRKAQLTVNLNSKSNITHNFAGRHDPCIVPRAVPVVEAAVALALLDLAPSLGIL